jgi:hypothetical protein
VYEKIAHVFRLKIASATGRVPRQLRELSQVIQLQVERFGSGVAAVNQYFEETPSRDGKKWGPNSKLDYFLNIYSARMEEVFVNLHTSYYRELPPSIQTNFVKICTDVLTYSKSDPVPTQYPSDK